VLNSTQNFSHLLQWEHFQIGGLNGQAVGKMCVFQWKTGLISEMVRDRA